MSYMRAAKALLLLIMLGLVMLPTFIFMNIDFGLRPARAQPGIMLEVPGADDIPADGRVFYVQANDVQRFRFLTDDDSELSHGDVDHFPSGMRTVSVMSGRAVDVHVGNDGLANFGLPADSELPASYGITFYSKDDTGTDISEASVIFIIEPRDDALGPSPSVMFDKEIYSPGDVAVVVVSDPHIDCRVLGVPDDITFRIPISFDSDPVFSFPPDAILSRDPFSTNEFRATLNIPLDAPAGTVAAQYTPVRSDSCVYGPESSDAITAAARVTDARLQFDRPTYSLDDLATITLVDSTVPAGAPLQVSIGTHTNPGGSLPIVLDQISENTFSREIRLTSTQPTVLSNAEPEVTATLNIASANVDAAVILTATYDDAGDADPQITAMVLPERRLSFDLPAGSSSYNYNELVTLRLQDAAANLDPLNFETTRVMMCSYNMSEASAPLIGERNIFMAETGRNTGQFVSSYIMSFVNETDDRIISRISGEPNVDRELILEEIRNSTITASDDGETLLIAKFEEGARCELTPQQFTDALHPSVTVNPPVFVDLFGESRGEVSGANLHSTNYPPRVSVSTVNCNQYNYGADLDEDGICDNWETTYGLKLYYPAGGSSYTFGSTCDPCPLYNHKDVFLEIDYFRNSNNSPACTATSTTDNLDWRPADAAINAVEAEFRNSPVTNDDGVNGIELHIYIGEEVNPSNCFKKIHSWGEPGTPDGAIDSYDELKYNYFGTSTERLITDKGKAKFQVFLYGVSMPIQDQDEGSTGVAEIVGNDLVVSLGAAGFGNTPEHMQGTLMHELGHNLGLRHGGFDDGINDYNTNCKPHYPSVMSYIHQTITPYTSPDPLKFAPLLDEADAPNESGSPDRKIPSDDPDENDVLRIWPVSPDTIDIVWGTQNTAGGPVTVRSEVVGDAWWEGDVNWNWANGILDGDADNPVPSGGSITNLGITGCQYTGAVLQTYSSDDWNNLQYDIRHLNPANWGSGFGLPDSIASEMNSSTIRDIRVAGIVTLEEMIPSTELDPIVCEDPTITSDASRYEVGETITINIRDSDANKDPEDPDELQDISITSSSSGFDTVAQETGDNSGNFELEIETSAIDETGKLRVADGDIVHIEYEDFCPADINAESQVFHYEVEIGPPEVLVNTDGGSGNDITASTVSFQGEEEPEEGQVKQEFRNKLLLEPNDTEYEDEEFVVENVSNMSVATLLRNDQLDLAIQKLEVLREYIDGTGGGRVSDDLFNQSEDVRKVLQFFDNNIASLKVAVGLPYVDDDPFFMTSTDLDCGGPDNDCQIYGYSETVTAAVDTFRIDTLNHTMIVDLIGRGDTQLVFQSAEVKEILDIAEYRPISFATNRPYDFEVLDENSQNMTILIKDLVLYPRTIAIEYSPFDFPIPSPNITICGVTAITLFGCDESGSSSGSVGEPLFWNIEITNDLPQAIPCTVVTQVLNPLGQVVSIDVDPCSSQGGGEVQPGELAVATGSWTPDETGEHSVTAFVIDNLDNPRTFYSYGDADIFVR